MTTALHDATFDEAIAGADAPVLVDFTAAWCPPCRMMGPVLEELAAERAGRLVVASVDVDENIEVPRRYDVMSMPTFLLFVGGRPVARLVGARPKARLVAEIDHALRADALNTAPAPPPAPVAGA